MTQLIADITHLLNVIAGHRLVIEKIHDWGIKEAYHVNDKELILLIRAGAEIITINKDNGDGTYLHKVKFMDSYFMQSTLKVITP